MGERYYRYAPVVNSPIVSLFLYSEFDASSSPLLKASIFSDEAF